MPIIQKCLILITISFLIKIISCRADQIDFKEKFTKIINQELELLDSLSRPAANSPDFIVIEKSSFLDFKEKLSDTLLFEGINPFNYYPNSGGVDSSSVSSSTIENLILNENASLFGIEFIGKRMTINLPNWSLVLFIFILLFLIYFTLRYYSLIIQDVSVHEQLESVTSDFESYKKSTIIKERKLMRDLIDVKNKMEELNTKDKAHLN